MTIDPIVVLDYLRWTVYTIYGVMFPLIAVSVWLEFKHPTLYAKLPRWLQ